MLEIKVRQRDDVLILDLTGQIDVNAANLITTVGECLSDGCRDFICNLEDIALIDYMGISVLVLAYKEVINHHGRMKLINLSAHLKGVLAISGMERAIEIFTSEDLALNSFKEDKIISEIKKIPLRRRFKRLPIDLKIQLNLKNTLAPICLNADILNLSAIGAFIFGCNKFNLGEEIVLKMKLAPSPQELVLSARVVWIPDRQVQIHEYPGIGVEFYDISTQDQERIVEFIQRNFSSLPTD